MDWKNFEQSYFPVFLFTRVIRGTIISNRNWIKLHLNCLIQVNATHLVKILRMIFILISKWNLFSFIFTICILLSSFKGIVHQKVKINLSSVFRALMGKWKPLLCKWCFLILYHQQNHFKCIANYPVFISFDVCLKLWMW